MNLIKEAFLHLTCLIPLLLIQIPYAEAQKVTGVIKDQENGFGVAYATVSVPQQKKAAIASENGYFELTDVDLGKSNHELVVSSLGYQELTITLDEIPADTMVLIQLTPSVIVLEEVIVSEEEQSPREIVGECYKRFRKNFSRKAHTMPSYYREWIESRGVIYGYSDAYGILLLNGHSRSDNNLSTKRYTYDLMQWKNIRRSDYLVEKDVFDETKEALLINTLLVRKDEYLLLDVMNPSKNKDYDFDFDGYTSYGSHMIFRINFSNPDNNRNGKILINEQDYGLIELSWEQSSRDGVKEGNYPESFRAKYSLMNESYILNYVEYNWLIRTTDNEVYRFHTEINNYELLDGAVPDLNSGQREVLYGEMVNPEILYKQQFWKNNSNIFPDEELEKIEKNSASENPYSEQFYTNSGKRLIPLPEGYDSYQKVYENNALFDVYFRDF
jgi:hypothetical protein